MFVVNRRCFAGNLDVFTGISGVFVGENCGFLKGDLLLFSANFPSFRKEKKRKKKVK